MDFFDKDHFEDVGEEKRVEIFISNFKSLEAFLSRKANVKENFVPFSQALNYVYSKKIFPGVLTGENYDFLRSAAELRNVLSHNNDICSPTAKFVHRFVRLSNALIYPAKALDIATPLGKMLTCSLKDQTGELIEKMNENGFSHVPVVEKGKFIGVFSVSTLFDRALKEPFTYSPEKTVEDFKEYLMNHTNERFLYVLPTVSAYSLKGSLTKSKSHERRTAVIFVTSNGTNRGNLLGMITETDLLKLEV